MSIWDWNGDPKINPPATIITTSDSTEIKIPANLPGSGSGQSITTITDISKLFGSLQGYSISVEEKKELSLLKEEHAFKIKMQKIANFKKIDPAMRQFVINAFTWSSTVNDLNSTTVEKSPRMLELENKDGSSGLMVVSLDGLWRGLNSMVTLPEGVSLEELRTAHIEATLEEEMLNEANT